MQGFKMPSGSESMIRLMKNTNLDWLVGGKERTASLNKHNDKEDTNYIKFVYLRTK